MKAVVSNRIYLDFREDTYSNIVDKLTFKLPSKVPGGIPITIRLYNTIGSKMVISIPYGRTDLIPPDYQIIDVTIDNQVKFPDFMFDLRSDQEEIYDKINGSCLLDAKPGWGKTFCGIAVAAKLGAKTLVIVHTLALRDQWEVEIRKTLGIQCGIIGSGQVNYNSCITVGNIQTLRKHANKLQSEFGTILVDEVHRAPSKIFSETLNILKAKNKIGLSGTMKRKDMMHIVLPSYFGTERYIAKDRNRVVPEIHMFKTGIVFSGNASIPWATRINELVEKPEYIDMVFGLASAYADRGHKVLIVSDRTSFLETGKEILGDRSVLVTGTVKDRNAEIDKMRKNKADIICGAISIFKEGISENYLSCVILATPINNDPMLEQLVGRIMRPHPGKETPIVVDLILQGNTGKTQANARANMYFKQGWKTKVIEI